MDARWDSPEASKARPPTTTILFDTLRFSRTLRDKGHFSPEQAEALAEALSEASQDNLATKTDIADPRTEIASSKAEIIKWMCGTIGFQTIIILGAVIALARLTTKG